MLRRFAPAAAMAVALLLASGCGNPPGLDPDEVSNLPPGNATGDDASGDYDLEAYTTRCDGNCPLLGAFQVSTCDVGTVVDLDADFVQQDGSLTVDVDTPLLEFRVQGGIDADGSFDVGAYATQLSGEIELVARFQGTVSPDGQLVGTGVLLASGEVQGERIDCLAEYEVTGSR